MYDVYVRVYACMYVRARVLMFEDIFLNQENVQGSAYCFV